MPDVAAMSNVFDMTPSKDTHEHPTCLSHVLRLYQTWQNHKTWKIFTYSMSQFKLASNAGVIELTETNKKAHSPYGLLSKLKELLAPEISKFTKLIKLQKNLSANWKLLNDFRLIILIKTNKKAYERLCFIFKIGDATSTWIYFSILVHTWNGKVACGVLILFIASCLPLHMFIGYLPMCDCCMDFPMWHAILKIVARGNGGRIVSPTPPATSWRASCWANLLSSQMLTVTNSVRTIQMILNL